MTDLLLLGLMIAIFVIGIFHEVVRCLELKEQKRMNDYQIKTLDKSVVIDIENIMLTFNSFIDLVMNEYLQLNVEFKDIQYINTELESEIFKDIAKDVYNKISPYMVHRLSLVYSMEKEEDLTNIITNTVYLKVLDYIINKNGIKNNVPNIDMIAR